MSDNKNDMPDMNDNDPLEPLSSDEGFSPDLDDLELSSRKRPGISRALGGVFFVLLIGAVVFGGYSLVRMYTGILSTGLELNPKASTPSIKAANNGGQRAVSGDYMVLDLYFPSGASIVGERRSVPRASSARDTAIVIINEFLAGPRGQAGGIIPEKAKLNGVFLGNDSILYIDLSDEFRRNFQGNAMQEYLLLKALHKSMMKNVYQVDGIRLLIDGSEIDSVGGHLQVRGLLGDAVSSPFREAE